MTTIVYDQIDVDEVTDPGGYRKGVYIPVIDGCAARLYVMAFMTQNDNGGIGNSGDVHVLAKPLADIVRGVSMGAYNGYAALDCPLETQLTWLTQDMANTPDLIYAMHHAAKGEVDWHTSAVSIHISSTAMALVIQYDGSVLPAMPNGVIPAGIRFKVNYPMIWGGGTISTNGPSTQLPMTPAQVTDASKRPQGFSKIFGAPSVNVFFVPLFLLKEVVDGRTLTNLGNGNYAFEVVFVKPLNPNQSPNADAKFIQNGISTAMSTTWVKNDHGQITGLKSTITAAMIKVINSPGTIDINYTEIFPFLGGDIWNSGGIQHDHVSTTMQFGGVDSTAPVITYASIVPRASCPSPATCLQSPGPAGDWIISGDVYIKFSASDPGSSSFLDRWELSWVPSTTSQFVYPKFGSSTPSLPPAAYKIPAGMFATGKFSGSSTISITDYQIQFNTFTVWGGAKAGRGTLLLKVFDKSGNSSSFTVTPGTTGFIPEGIFANAGGPVFVETFSWTRQNYSGVYHETGYMVAYVIGGWGNGIVNESATEGWASLVQSWRIWQDGVLKGTYTGYNGYRLGAFSYDYMSAPQPPAAIGLCVSDQNTTYTPGAHTIDVEVTDKAGKVCKMTYPFTVAS